MRALRALGVALILLVLAMAGPVEAKPMPETRKALRDAQHDTLVDADKTSAQLLRDARKLLRDAALPAAPPLPSLPALPGAPAVPTPAPAPLLVHAGITMPGFRGEDETIALHWIGPSAQRWTGVYWLESDDGMVLPSLLDVSGDGMLLFMYGGSLSTDASIDGARYHFLGADGTYVVHEIPSIPLLDATPVLDRVSLAGAHASARGGATDAILLAPWNTLAEATSMGITLFAEGTVVEEFAIAGCADAYATVTEAGCRLMYAIELPPEVTHLELWRVDAEGARVVDERHARASLERGVAFAA